MPEPTVSIVVPAYNAARTIARTLSSVVAQPPVVEVIVVDDGSDDSEALRRTIADFPEAILLSHEKNLGKAAAMNTGIAASRGETVIILDADDQLVPGWHGILNGILKRWPSSAAICFAVSQSPDGQPTVSEPEYTGPLSFEDMLNDRHKGEYLPIFRGPAVRDARGYHDPGTRRECAQWSYLAYAKRAPLWIDSAVMRIYHEDQPGSLSSSLANPEKAAEIVTCYDRIFESFGDDYSSLAPLNARRRQLRHAVFSALAADRSKALRIWREAASASLPFESLAALCLMIIGGKSALAIVQLAKRLGLVRRYG